jgi:nucleolar protein 56
VEDRLEFYATGKKPIKNADAMVRLFPDDVLSWLLMCPQDKAVADLLAEGDDMAIDHEMIDAPLPSSTQTPKKEKKSKEKKDKEEKKDKKEKKRRHSEVKDTAAADAEDGEKKKKKKKRHSEA